MKKISTHLALVTAVMGVLSAVPAQAALDTVFNPADLIMGFRTNSGTGLGTTIMVNLGASTLYRDTTSDILNIGNIGTLLDTVYGIGGGDAAQWYERSTLFFGVMGALNGDPTNNSGSVGVGQDPNSTLYLTARRTGNGTAGLALSTRPGNSIPLDGAVQPAAGLADQLGTGVFNSNDSNGIVNIASGTTNSWNTYTTGSTSNDIGALFNIERAFTVGVLAASFGPVSNVENYVDLYRLPEFVGGNAPGTDGVGSFEGTFTISTSGQIDFVVTPEPTSAALLALATGALGLVRRRRASIA